MPKYDENKGTGDMDGRAEWARPLTGLELAEKYGIKVTPDQKAVDHLTGKRISIEEKGQP